MKTEYDAARAAGRTGMGFTEWRAGRVTQAAAAWVLATVFVRYCEDNGLIGPAFLAGPGERLPEAEERHEQFFREHPTRNDRDWLLAAIEHLADAHPTAAGLFDRRHNPLWELTPSYEAATALIAFWRRRADSGARRSSSSTSTVTPATDEFCCRRRPHVSTPTESSPGARKAAGGPDRNCSIAKSSALLRPLPGGEFAGAARNMHNRRRRKTPD
jgi:hypothetical protein